jgi:hypothetical protein
MISHISFIQKFPLGEVRENMLDQLHVVLDCVDCNVWLLLLLWLSYDLRDQLNFIFPCIQTLKSLAHTSTEILGTHFNPILRYWDR